MPCCIPRAVQLVVDDVGWREGWDLHDAGGPFRAGIPRLLGPADYRALADIGRRAGIRAQCAMVLCEWDPGRICADYPTTTPEGGARDNRRLNGPWRNECAEILRTQAPHLEIALHGVGHEYWQHGCMSRAEWFGSSPEERRPRHVLNGHLECFRRILDANGLGPATGHGFPQSFVPCAFRFLWNNADPDSTGAVVADAGIRRASTPFSVCTFDGDRPDLAGAGLEHGIFVLDRGNCGIPWYAWDTVPDAPVPNEICGVHWPNLLRPDPDENGAAVDAWVAHLAAIDGLPDAMTARNMAEACSQRIHREFTRLESGPDGTVAADATAIPAPYTAAGHVLPVVLKFTGPDRLQARNGIEGTVLAEWERHNAHFLSVLPGPAGRAVLVPRRPTDVLSPRVTGDGTFTVREVSSRDGALRVALTVFGQTRITISGVPGTPTDVRTAGAVTAGLLSVRDTEVTLNLTACDIAGTTAEVVLPFASRGPD